MSASGTDKIVHIIPTLDQAGAEKQMTTLVCQLRRRGWDVRVAVLTRDGPYRAELEAAGVPVFYVNKRGKVDFSALIRLRRWLEEVKPTIVQTWLFAATTVRPLPQAGHLRAASTPTGGTLVIRLVVPEWPFRLE
jgi:hypothetical protein